LAGEAASLACEASTGIDASMPAAPTALPLAPAAVVCVGIVDIVGIVAGARDPAPIEETAAPPLARIAASSPLAASLLTLHAPNDSAIKTLATARYTMRFAHLYRAAPPYRHNTK
jgi:hypothetical protein